MKKRILLVQEFLKKKGLYLDSINGIADDQTISALDQFLPENKNWSFNRKINGAIQTLAKENGLEIGPVDGWWRPDTLEAFGQLQQLLINNELPKSWRPEDIPNLNPNNWPVQYTPEFDRFYGNPGDNLVKLELPYLHRLSWEPYSSVRNISCHMLVKDSILRVLGKVLQHYGESKIRELRLDVFGGCFNKRQVRGGTRWSMHSWGIALDYDPNRNQLKWGRDKAVFARPEYDAWWSFWEEEGWVSLGRQRNFDWMHVQAAKI